MKRKLIFLLLLIVSVVTIVGIYIFRAPCPLIGEPLERIWEYNTEKNRDASTIILDCALLVTMTHPKSFLMMGHVSEDTIFDLRNISALYAKSDNVQRNRWLNSLIKKLEKDSVRESYDSYEPIKREYEKKWDEIEKFILKGDIKTAIEKIGDHPFLLAKIGGYYSSLGKKEEAIQFFQKALQGLNENTSEDIRYDTLRSTIMGYIELDDGHKAIKLYREVGKGFFNLPLQMIEAFVNKENYDSAFEIIHDNYWSLYDALITIAEGHIKQHKRILKKEHEQNIMSIVMQHKDIIIKLKILNRSNPGSHVR